MNMQVPPAAATGVQPPPQPRTLAETGLSRQDSMLLHCKVTGWPDRQLSTHSGPSLWPVRQR